MTDNENTNSEAIQYANNRDQWPDKALWDRLAAENDGESPADEKRCHHGVFFFDQRCGLPRYGEEAGEPHCIFHYSGERDPDDLREQLEAAVRSGADISYADLSGADLTDANLSGADLTGANLSRADLTHANLSEAVLQRANLNRADLGWANLSGANLRRANLRKARLWDANLSGADLFDANLSGADLAFANLSEAYLSRADLCGAQLQFAKLTGDIDLRDADLRGARLLGFELSPEAKLDGVQWDKGGIVLDEIIARGEENRQQQRDTFGDCAAIYRQIKMSYQASGDHQTAGQFFIREMECKRMELALRRGRAYSTRSLLLRPWESLSKRIQWPRRAWDYLTHYATRAFWFLSYHTCQHAENPARLLGIMAAVIVAFGFLHGWCGIEDSSGEYLVGPGAVWPSWAAVSGFGKALYFSVVTFTSLGYGDVQPTDGLGQFLVSFQVILGVIFIALFVGCIIRKVSR